MLGSSVRPAVARFWAPVVGLTRVLPQVLADTRKLLAEAWATEVRATEVRATEVRATGAPAREA